MARRRGFTLIELLVVIAIIGILAAMLFPVFARARESARKTQCLANVKNLAIAVNMYLTDYDRFFPTEHRADVRDWLENVLVVCSTDCDKFLTCNGTAGNPYLRVPVILDEYTKNRDVWRCPSATFFSDIVVNPTINGDWLAYMKAYNATTDGPCPNPMPCHPSFPPGWAGQVTDTIAQGWSGCINASQPGVFVQNYGVPRKLRDLATGSINDVAKYVVVADAGKELELEHTSQVAYPDMCRIDGVACAPNVSGKTCGGDWINCEWSQTCSPQRVDQGGTPTASTDVQFRKDHFRSRHLGGSNLGFADGHAKWMPSEKILFAGSENWSGYADGTNDLEGLAVCFHPTDKP